MITLQIFTTGGRLKYRKNRRGTGLPTGVSACGACGVAELAPVGVGEVLVELLGEVPGEVLALPRTLQLPAPANHVKALPNLARMARQFLGVPATSAFVERLFSVVGFAFVDRRKSQSAETLANLAFAKLNLPILQNFNDGGGAHVNDVWLFVIHPLRCACYAIGY